MLNELVKQSSLAEESYWQGYAQGYAQGVRYMFLLVLTGRFTAVPEDVAVMIGQAEPGDLEGLAGLAVNGTLLEIRRRLRATSGRFLSPDR